MGEERASVQVEPCGKRIRIMYGGQVIADTANALYVWEHGAYPQYYVPRRDIADGVLEPSGTTTHSARRGPAHHFTVVAGGRQAIDAAWTYDESEVVALRDHMRFAWAAMDAWFEEDEEVFVHPRSPYTRVDILASSRRVTVMVGGVPVAESSRPTFLFETGLPRRTYFRKTDVRMDRLIPSDTTSMCPYKGTARYWSLHTPAGDEIDIAWSYPTPLRESANIAGLVAFYDERVDVAVDGVGPERPTRR